MRTVLWSALAWLAIIPLAVANGLLRQAVLLPRLGAPVAQPLSGVLLMLAIAAVGWWLVGRLGARRPRTWLAIGAGWLLATVAFEFAIGLAAGRTWDQMLAPYRFVDGNLWPVVLAWVAAAPMALARLRGRLRPGPARA